MKSIMIHGIDKNLENMINSRARAEGLSINKSVKKLLEESLGIKPAQTGKHRDDFKEFCGLWSNTDLAEFEAETAEVFGHVKSDLKEAGNPIPINDVWIAAHAIETGAIVITYDSHFRKAAGLRLWDVI